LALVVGDAGDSEAAEPEALALATLAYAALGRTWDAEATADRLARATVHGPGPGGARGAKSLFGHTDSEAEADTVALTALAYAAAPSGAAPRPSRAWRIRRLASLRRADGLFGGAVTNGLCGLALMGLMQDPKRSVEITIGDEGGRTLSVAPDQWATVDLSPEEARQRPLTIRGCEAEPVQYLLLSRAASSAPLAATLSVVPQANPRVGDATITVTNGSGASVQAIEARASAPPGLEPHIADLEAAVLTGRVKGYTWQDGLLRLLFEDIPVGGSRAVTFRMRAARVPAVTEAHERAEVVPAGAARR